MTSWNEHPFLSLLDNDLGWWSAGDDSLAEADLDQLEDDLGMGLPAEFRRFQLMHAATMVGTRDDVWPKARPGRVGPAWTFKSGFLVLGLGEGAPENLDIRAATVAFRIEHPEGRRLVPFFAHVNDPDYFCFDPAGRIVSWASDTADEPEVKHESFDEFLLAETRHLIQKKNAIKAALAESRRNWRERAVYPERD